MQTDYVQRFLNRLNSVNEGDEVFSLFGGFSLLVSGNDVKRATLGLMKENSLVHEIPLYIQPPSLEKIHNNFCTNFKWKFTSKKFAPIRHYDFESHCLTFSDRFNSKAVPKDSSRKYVHSCIEKIWDGRVDEIFSFEEEDDSNYNNSLFAYTRSRDSLLKCEDFSSSLVNNTLLTWIIADRLGSVIGAIENDLQFLAKMDQKRLSTTAFFLNQRFDFWLRENHFLQKLLDEHSPEYAIKMREARLQVVNTFK